MATQIRKSGTSTRLAASIGAWLFFVVPAAHAGWTIRGSSGAPRISGTPPTSVIAGSTYDFRPTASDPNGDTLKFTINKLPVWATFDKTTGRFSGTPRKSDAAKTRDIRISVTDGKSTVSLPKFTLVVYAGSTPSISGTPATSSPAGSTYSFQPVALDADGQTLRFAVINKPTWATFDSSTGKLTGTPGLVSVGSYTNIGISVTDGASTVSLPAFAIAVTAPTNAAPTISGTPPTSVQAGQSYGFTPSASDPEGQALKFSIVNQPRWAIFDQATGRLSGTPTTTDAGTYASIVISVSDGTSVTFLPMFAITVTAPAVAANSPPTISGSPSATATEGTAYAFQPTASDADGDALTYSASGLPGWLTINSGTGRVSGTPATGSAGTYGGIVVSVSDGKAMASLSAFTITVSAAPNNPPTISGSPATAVTVGQTYSFTPTASDPEGQALAFGIANKPAWASFSTTTGRLSGTPASANVGSYANIVISVSDGKASATLRAFTITVSAAPNNPPTISGSPAAAVTVGQTYLFTPTASDPDGQVLAFGIANKPAWASFSTTTGQLSGTPAAASAGTYSNIVISVSDGTAAATLPPFSINVANTVGSATLSWVAPTQNEDGSALTNLAGYKVRYGQSTTALSQVLDIPNAAITSATIENLAVGTWYFTVTAYTNVGVESAPAGPATKSIQ